MFYDAYLLLCKQRGESPSKVAENIGLNRSAVVKWKKGTIPNGPTIQKLAEYFNVATDSLLGVEKEKMPTLEGERLPDGLNDIYFSLAKDLQDAKIDPEDIRNFARIISKNMRKENDEL